MNIFKKHWKLLIVILLGLIPLLWFKPGYIIARGDYFPNWFNSIHTFYQDMFLWQKAGGGSPSRYPAYLIVGAIWYFFQSLRIPGNVIQIIFLTSNFLGAGLAMYFLASVVYKRQKITPFIASIFYMFNIFALMNQFLDGVTWTFVFLPLLLGLFVKIVENLESNQSTVKYTVCFIIVSTVLLSFSSMNPPLLVLSTISVLFVFLYYFFFKPSLRPRLFRHSLALATFVVVINIWWIIPTYFYFYASSGHLVSEVTDITAFAWTHHRASFLNLFWLNGTWGWSADYVPYIDTYSNPALILFSFIPMIIAFMGLLFRDSGYKRFNCYLGAIVLFMVFLQKGLHPPLENINLFLYQYVPGFSIFREPVPKFGLILIIFLALLVGYSTNSVLEGIQRARFKYKSFVSIAFIAFIVAIFLISTFPFFIVKRVMADTTGAFPYSAYVNFPDYWYKATNWINSQEGDFKVLLTPNESFYVMPHKWGFYGAGGALPARLLVKSSLQNIFGYVKRDNDAELITRLYATIRDDHVLEFQQLLTLMKVKYILQRNDVGYVGNSQIISPMSIKNFFDKQINIKFVKRFGDLDLYAVDSTSASSYIYRF